MEPRRTATWIVAEASARGASVASVVRRHGLNANLVFKWIRRACEGWPDRRRTLSKTVAVTVARKNATRASVPVEVVELNAASAPRMASTKPVRAVQKNARRGATEVSPLNGARLSLDTDVGTEALRRVLSALGDL